MLLSLKTIIGAGLFLASQYQYVSGDDYGIEFTQRKVGLLYSENFKHLFRCMFEDPLKNVMHNVWRKALSDVEILQKVEDGVTT